MSRSDPQKPAPRAIHPRRQWLAHSMLLVGHLALMPMFLFGLDSAAAIAAEPTTPLSGPVALSGDVPLDYFPDIQSKSDTIWSHLEKRLSLRGDQPAPVVHFSLFDRGTQSPAWTAWQKSWTRSHPVIWSDWTALRSQGERIEISRQWIDENIDEIFPFPKTFLAFHYDGTNRIQINPKRTFLASVQLDPYGIRQDLDGRGYYTEAHEMLHYALELKGVVPTKLHHCLMLYRPPEGDTPAILEQIMDFLVQEKMLAASARYRGLSSERSFAPCAKLTADELAEVDQFHAVLASLPSAD